MDNKSKAAIVIATFIMASVLVMVLYRAQTEAFAMSEIRYQYQCSQLKIETGFIKLARWLNGNT